MTPPVENMTVSTRDEGNIITGDVKCMRFVTCLLHTLQLSLSAHASVIQNTFHQQED
jgi:hypothetical protein